MTKYTESQVHSELVAGVFKWVTKLSNYSSYHIAFDIVMIGRKFRILKLVNLFDGVVIEEDACLLFTTRVEWNVWPVMLHVSFGLVLWSAEVLSVQQRKINCCGKAVSYLFTCGFAHGECSPHRWDQYLYTRGFADKGAALYTAPWAKSSSRVILV